MRSALRDTGDDETRGRPSPAGGTSASSLRRPPGLLGLGERRPPVSRRLSPPVGEVPRSSRIVLRPGKSVR